MRRKQRRLRPSAGWRARRTLSGSASSPRVRTPALCFIAPAVLQHTPEGSFSILALSFPKPCNLLPAARSLAPGKPVRADTMAVETGQLFVRFCLLESSSLPLTLVCRRAGRERAGERGRDGRVGAGAARHTQAHAPAPRQRRRAAAHTVPAALHTHTCLRTCGDVPR